MLRKRHKVPSEQINGGPGVEISKGIEVALRQLVVMNVFD
jgi:hypothetical protein